MALKTLAPIMLAAATVANCSAPPEPEAKTTAYSSPTPIMLGIENICLHEGKRLSLSFTASVEAIIPAGENKQRAINHLNEQIRTYRDSIKKNLVHAASYGMNSETEDVHVVSLTDGNLSATRAQTLGLFISIEWPDAEGDYQRELQDDLEKLLPAEAQNSTRFHDYGDQSTKDQTPPNPILTLGYPEIELSDDSRCGPPPESSLN